LSELAELETYQDCKHLIARRMRGEAAQIPAKALKPQRVDERLLQCVWFDKLLAEEGLKTAGGRTLEILDAGRWNHEAGPDFLGASLLINGRPRKGDVEVHADARDWKRHDHHRDFEYNRVILHAVLDAPDGLVADPKHNGEEVERFVMREFIRPDLDSVRRGLNFEDYPFDEGAGRGKCAAIIAEMSDAFLERYFDLAARERMEAKIRRFADQAHGENLNQVFYQGLMTAMGHKGGKALFFLLSKRTPLDELSDFIAAAPATERALRMEAILLHVANLVPQEIAQTGQSIPSAPSISSIQSIPSIPPNPDSSPDPETLQYLARLREHWAAAQPYFCDRVIPATNRWYAGVRPVNFAPRRLAGVASLVANAAQPQRFFDDLLALFKQVAPRSPTAKTAREAARRFAAVFSVESDGYWSRRYSFTANKAAEKMNLIGDSRASSIILNAFLPMAILQARAQGDADLEAQAYALYAKFPKLQANSVTKFMRQRLFGDDPRAKDLLTTEARHQALFYLFNDCCDNVGTTCDQCAYLRAE